MWSQYQQLNDDGHYPQYSSSQYTFTAPYQQNTSYNPYHAFGYQQGYQQQPPQQQRRHQHRYSYQQINDPAQPFIPLNDIKPNPIPAASEVNDAWSTTESTRPLIARQIPWRKRTTGWRFGAISCASSASVVFLINLSAAIWAAVTVGIHQGKGVLFNGSCTKIRPLNVGVHLLINILSTVLLSGSNYCMQCLSAPTRKEIDEAHKRRIWLDIGVPSIRNLRRISGRRAFLWWILGLSSLPLHLL